MWLATVDLLAKIIPCMHSPFALFNPLSSNINMHFLLTVLGIFRMVLVGRISMKIKSSYHRWSFPSFSWPVLCGSRKYPYPHHRGSMEIPRGRGSWRPKFLKESTNLNWNFQRGGGLKPKKPSVGWVWIFSGTTHLFDQVVILWNWMLVTSRA